MEHGGNVIDELTTDHREVDDLFARIEQQLLGDPGRRELADKLTAAVMRHSAVEQRYLYPAVREHVDGGDELADKEIEAHGDLGELLKDLEGRPADDGEFDHLVAKLKLLVCAHAADQEQHLFPRLADACSGQDLDDLGEQIRKARRTAPTRPHPFAPDNKLLAPGAGLVDRLRDALTGRGR
ncbi:hemerythrin domain-containing protein [Streptantibioticus silvisoli]|uniref:Hemerythrin domain-containing protein n=1 Tax=Streptantibioticus silvisoli TaxID=2705255 RepID=A0ABT6VZB0_9ACTN|nr:hemerythrin domain-containing protein [Streptantibioticus silvisoli]MDI5963824.1 hemerythrin domain-containing protein [Streptantibioticus silvisoli]